MEQGKTLYRISEQGQISGVCAGIAEYVNMDVTLVRVLFVVISFLTGIPVVLYIVFWAVLPDKKNVFVQEERQEDPEEDIFDL